MIHRSLLLALVVALAPFARGAQGGVVEGVRVYTTAKDTALRMGLSDRLQLLPARQSPETDVAVFINPEKTFQTVLGFGGAITDASAEVYAGLADDVKRELMRAYYDADEGLGYSLLRTPIHSCDFASESHTYIEEGDADLSTFDVAPDREFRIPMILEALRTAGGSITTIASPWSAPAFMKGREDMLRGGKLLPRYRSAWARYYAKFIRAYEAEGVPIWGITVQNEPMAVQTWESMIYTAEEERDFVRDHLGPTLAADGLGDVKVIVWDHNRDLIGHRANTILGDPEAARYVWGVGFHWYETWAGGEEMHQNVAAVKQAYPEFEVLLTEACVEGFDPARYQHWPNAERYGKNVIRDLNAGAAGWLDWNILLDDRGGPNHVGNHCFAPIHADSESGALIYTPSYHYLGHFAKFIRPGARRVSAISSRSSLDVTSFVHADGRLATVVLNLEDAPVTYRFCVGDEEAVTTIPARAIQTLLHDLNAPTGWVVDFFDDFEVFDPENWQDQRIWVNNEAQCYLPDGAAGTREVSDGTLKVKVVNVGEMVECDNLSKTGVRHPDTQYVAGRVCSKNRKEFIKGRWTARLRTWGNGEAGMFPAWWILGARNNEPPVQEDDENIAWPLTGSGEIDIFEHHGESGADKFTTGAIKSLGADGGDWWTLRKGVPATLDEWHEYSVEWAGSDLVYRVDGVEVHRNPGEGDSYPEPMFAILNYAKISDHPMTGEWVMEVDWVKHERWDERFVFPDPTRPADLVIEENEDSTVLSWSGDASPGVRFSVYRATRPGDQGELIAFELDEARFVDVAPAPGTAHFYSVVASAGAAKSARSEVVHTELPSIEVPARIEAEHYFAMNGVEAETCGDEGGGFNLGFFDPGDTLEYKIDAPSAGRYTFAYRLASLNGSGGFEVLLDGEVVDRQEVAATGGWQTYVTKRGAAVPIEGGEHTLTFRSVGDQWNINWFALER